MGRSLIGLFIVALLPILTACNDGVGPRLELTEFELCSKPNWIAVRRGSAWDFIDVPEPQTPFGRVKVSTPVPSRATVAVGISSTVQIYQLLQEELGQLRCQPGFPSGSAFRTISGSVAGIPDGALFQMAYGPSFGYRTGPGTFTAYALGDTTATIIATHRPLGAQKAAGILLVRNFSSSGQSAFPPLDFSSSGARVLDSAQLNVSGAGGTVFRSYSLRTGGTTLSLGGTSSIPAHYYALTGPGDPDDIYFVTLSSAAKSVTWYYAGVSGNASVVFGPDLPAITAENIADLRCRRMAASFPVQAEMASGARVTFSFSTGPRSSASVSVLVSEGFRGASDKWEVEIPNFGPNRACAVSTSVAPTIVATAFSGNFLLQLGAPPVAGDLIRSVTATRPGP